jgi:hypothetical protein
MIRDAITYFQRPADPSTLFVNVKNEHLNYNRKDPEDVRRMIGQIVENLVVTIQSISDLEDRIMEFKLSVYRPKNGDLDEFCTNIAEKIVTIWSGDQEETLFMGFTASSIVADAQNVK